MPVSFAGRPDPASCYDVIKTQAHFKCTENAWRTRPTSRSTCSCRGRKPVVMTLTLLTVGAAVAATTISVVYTTTCSYPGYAKHSC